MFVSLFFCSIDFVRLRWCHFKCIFERKSICRFIWKQTKRCLEIKCNFSTDKSREMRMTQSLQWFLFGHVDVWWIKRRDTRETLVSNSLTVTEYDIFITNQSIKSHSMSNENIFHFIFRIGFPCRLRHFSHFPLNSTEVIALSPIFLLLRFAYFHFYGFICAFVLFISVFCWYDFHLMLLTAMKKKTNVCYLSDVAIVWCRAIYSLLSCRFISHSSNHIILFCFFFFYSFWSRLFLCRFFSQSHFFLHVHSHFIFFLSFCFVHFSTQSKRVTNSFPLRDFVHTTDDKHTANGNQFSEQSKAEISVEYFQRVLFFFFKFFI